MGTRYLLILVTFFLPLFIIIHGIIEFNLHCKRRDRTKIRIHINGTRGKSSVVRLIASGLRAAGYRVLAKTTGALPRIIYPDGTEKDIFRLEKPNIIEQLYVFKEANLSKADAVVIECMALLPSLQKICEDKIIKSHIGVITNVRPDHLDVMGPSIYDVAESLATTLPIKGVAFTAEKDFFNIIKTKADILNTDLHYVNGDRITNEMMEGFKYLEHRDNVSLALAVCNHLGIKEVVALKGMYEAEPDPGVLRTFKMTIEERWFEFINAFSANDAYSTLKIWERMARQFTSEQIKFVLIHTRKDRTQRSADMVNLLTNLPVNYVIIVGTGTRILGNFCIRRGIDAEKIYDLGNIGPEKIFNRIQELAGQKNIIFGIGNIVGLGMEIVEFFKQKKERYG